MGNNFSSSTAPNMIDSGDNTLTWEELSQSPQHSKQLQLVSSLWSFADWIGHCSGLRVEQTTTISKFIVIHSWLNEPLLRIDSGSWCCLQSRDGPCDKGRLVPSEYQRWYVPIYVTPGFLKEQNQSRYMRAQEVHTYNNRIEISKQCLYKAEYMLY
jgi:hypothetical protein